MSDNFADQNGLNQYYLQVQALTPSGENPAATPVSHSNNFNFLQVYLPIALLVGFVGISIIVLFSKRVMNQGGLSRALGLAIIVFAIAVGSLNIQKSIELESHASPDNTPVDLTISQVTDSGFVMEWQTESTTNGFIQLYQMDEPTATSLTFMSEYRDRTIHQVVVDSLEPNSDYAIRVYSGGEWFNLEGKPIVVTTLP